MAPNARNTRAGHTSARLTKDLFSTKYYRAMPSKKGKLPPPAIHKIHSGRVEKALAAKLKKLAAQKDKKKKGVSLCKEELIRKAAELSPCKSPWRYDDCGTGSSRGSVWDASTRGNNGSVRSYRTSKRASKPADKVNAKSEKAGPVKASTVKRSRSRAKFTHKKKKSPSTNQVGGPSKLKLPKLIMDLTEHSSSVKASEFDDHLFHVEVCAKSKSAVRASELKVRVKSLLKHYHGRGPLDFRHDSYLRDHVQSIQFVPSSKVAPKGPHAYQVHVFQLNEDGPSTEDWTEDDMATAKHWVLPNKHRDFDGVWENLIFDSEIKQHLLNYAITTLMYSNKNIDSNIISCNRVILLHGPPGTGKTSLCRALAQKLCIRMAHKYKYGQLVEINSHGLFSKWFSESGKLVVKMFNKIQQFVDNQDCLVCVLIDEVESLTSARRHMMNGNEPSDSIRVVNALLTQLDIIKRHPNVLILTTSNVTGAIDLAFVDRADVKQYIGTPSAEAIYTIYKEGIHEVMRAGFIKSECKLVEWRLIEKKQSSNITMRNSQRLRALAMKSYGLSGRILKKVPILAHAVYLKAKKSSDFGVFTDAMAKCIENQFTERTNLGRDPEI